MSDDQTPPSSSNDRARHDAYAAFREPPFRRFMLGMLLVQLGSGIQSTAIGWDIYDRTDSAMALALVALVQVGPMLFLTLPAGYLADVLDRRKLIAVGMLGTTLTSLGLAAVSYADGAIWLMYLLVFWDSIALRMTAPARTALVPLLVPAAKLENAMTWRTSLGQISALLGPAAAGFILVWSVPMTYVFCALMQGIFLVILFTLHVPPAARAVPGRMVAQVMDGVRFVWHRKVLLGTISLDLFAVLLGGVVYLLPMFAKDVIDLSGTGISPELAMGWLRSAPAAGALIMALTLAHTPPIRKAGATMLWAVAGFGAATVVFGLSRNLWLSLAMLLLTGALDNVSVVVRHTLVALLTPNEMRGRVSAVTAIFIGSSNEIGGVRAGAVASLFGPVIATVAGGVASMLVVLTWAGLFPRLRQFGALADVSEEAETAPARRKDEAAEAVESDGG